MFTIPISRKNDDCGWNKWRERERERMRERKRERKMKGTKEGGLGRPHGYVVRK
jgi:hypothetical protein